MIQLLAPRFIDQGATGAEQAASRAELFLERQELRSGLLVSRRAHSYRFVHLIFQEFLAAWQLSNRDFDEVKGIIASRLRLAKWFETLQLLGGLWAKESDEKVDRYVAWLLSQWGTTIAERAPIVALTANIAKDSSGTAELKTETRKRLTDCVEATLDAFRRGSGVPAKTQVEILEALGQLGAAVKSHLMDATKASLFQVRRRAIEMLLPHLSDDELFGMTHIFRDASREPICRYVIALKEREPDRTARTVSCLQYISETCDGGIYKSANGVDEIDRVLLTHVTSHNDHYYGDSRRSSLRELVRTWPDSTTRQLLTVSSVEDLSYYVRMEALSLLAKRDEWADDETRQFLKVQAVEDSEFQVRTEALSLLAKRDAWADSETRLALNRLATGWEYSNQTISAISVLASRESWIDDLRSLICTAVSGASRGHAACLWLGRNGSTNPKVKRRVFTQNADGHRPHIDPLLAVTTEHLDIVARNAGMKREGVD